MGFSKYLIAVWTAVAVYTLFSFMYGPNGMSAFNELLAERDLQRANIRELENINEELEKTKNNLIYDYDTVLVHARRMGYGYEDEQFIRIVGLNNDLFPPFQTGNVYAAQAPFFVSDLTIKIASLSVGLLIFAFLLTMELINKKIR